MARIRGAWWGLLVLLAVLVTAAAWSPIRGGIAGRSGPSEWVGEGLGAVRAELIRPSLLISGLTSAATQTAIAAEVEQIAGVPPVYGVFGMAAPTRIIEVVPGGAVVREGDVLCRFDASEYEERARLQRLDVDDARSALADAERGVGVAEVELVAFRDGDRLQRDSLMQAELAMARVDRTRSEDAFEWSNRMSALGYVASADVDDRRIDRVRAEVNERRAAIALQTFRDFTVEKILRDLEAKLEQARNTRAFAVEQLKAAETRLKHLDEQVGHCTIRAPHDGTVLYADTYYREYYQIREGAEVYPMLDLFYLPDLDEMEVELFVHERNARHVVEGQEAVVTLEGFPGRTFPGRVKTVDLLPTPDWRHFGAWQQFRVRVALDAIPEGILPEMSARVEVFTEAPRTELTVPASAVRYDDGRPRCLVHGPHGPEPRPIDVERGSVDRLIVLSGLENGDRVLLNPRRIVAQ